MSITETIKSTHSNTIVGGKISEYISKTYKSLKEGEKDTYVVIILSIFIIVIVVFSLVYLFYMINLESSECKRLGSLYPNVNKQLHSLNFADPNCQYTLKDYYIKTAFNSCNGGKYKNDFVDICVLKSVLKDGVRCLDFEIYSINDQPVIASSTDSNYNVKETYNFVAFSDAMSTIMNYAFSNSTAPNPADPIILHLRFKSSNQTMFTNLATIFQNNNWRLLPPEYGKENQICDNSSGSCYSSNLGNMKLQDLAGKIIVIVDRSNTDFMDNEKFYSFVNMTSNSMFMRCIKYYDAQYTPDMTELQEYNKQNMTIVIPDNNSDPDNPSGIVCRELGCQMISERFEKQDSVLSEYQKFFNSAGYAFVLKPEKLRFIQQYIQEAPPNNPLLNYSSRTTSSNYYNFKT